MKRLLLLCLLIPTAHADEYVQGHVRADGTYVQGYYRSSPDSHKFNNYGSEGNVNPYTGQKGTERNEYSTPRYSDPYAQPNPYSTRRR
jgi:hypothetical protein